MWAEDTSGEHAFEFETTLEGGYSLQVTDFRDVYKETISFSTVMEKGVDLEYALSTPQQSIQFLNVLAKRLKSAKFDLETKTIKIDDATAVPPLIWTFELNRLNDCEAKLVLGDVCKQLLTNTRKSETEHKQQQTRKNQLIRGLLRAVELRTDFVVPRPLEAEFRRSINK